MNQELDTSLPNEPQGLRRLLMLLGRYVPLITVVVTGVMLTAIALHLMTGSKWEVLGAGVSFTALFAGYMVMLLGRAAHVERMVNERTADLEKEITERKQAERKIRDQYVEIETYAAELEAANNELQHTQNKLLETNLSLEKNVGERTAELENANEELEAFTYSVSHDLRAPLRHIDGFSRMLQNECKEQLSDDAKAYLSKISASTHRMGILIDGLLNLSRIGRKNLEIESVDLNTIFEEVKTELQPEVAGRDIEWTAQDLPVASCDPVLIKVVMTNLLANAIKFTRNTDCAVIEVRPLPEAELGFMVSDNGAGFDMEYAGKLFGVFERLHRKDDFEGTGIGLATVQRIMTNHNGRVWAEATVNNGATFHVAFPRR